MFEATLHRADPEAPLRWLAAAVCVVLAATVIALGVGVAMLARYLMFLVLYVLWLLFGGIQPVYVAAVAPPELVEIRIDSALEEEADVSWEGVTQPEPEELLAGGPPAPVDPTLQVRAAQAEAMVESRLLVAMIGTRGDALGSVDVLESMDELSTLDTLFMGGSSSGTGLLIGAGDGDLVGSSGGAITDLGGGQGWIGGGGGGRIGGISDVGTKFELLDATGSGADVKARTPSTAAPVRCTVSVRPRQDAVLSVEGCPAPLHAAARRAVTRAGRDGERGTVTVLLVP